MAAINRHAAKTNEFTEYAAAINMLLSYYKCEDDWADEHRKKAQRYRLIDGDDSDPAFAGFNEELKPELVYCSLQEAIDDETAEDYVLDELVEDEACPEELRTRAYLKHEVIEGRLYYYYIFKYKKSRKQRQKFAAACDIGGGLFYTIETEWIWRKEELTMEALIDFLKIRVE